MPKGVYDGPHGKDISKDERARLFVEEFLDPEADHSYGWLKRWASEHDVPYATAASWRHNPTIRAEIERRLAEYNTSPERIQAVADAMHAAARNGDTKAASLYLQFVERLAPTKVIVQSTPAAELSDAELRTALEEMAAEGA